MLRLSAPQSSESVSLRQPVPWFWYIQLYGLDGWQWRGRRCPGDDQRDRQAGGHGDRHSLDDPVGRTDQVEGEVDALQGHPAEQHVCDAHADYIAAFQLLNYGHRVYFPGFLHLSIAKVKSS